MKLIGLQSVTLKSRTVQVGTGRSRDGQDLVVIGLGRRLGPDTVGNNRRIEPAAVARLSRNRRMHFTDVALTTESAVALHGLLGQTLHRAGIIPPQRRSIFDQIREFASQMIMSTILLTYYEHKRRVDRVKIVEAPE